MRSWMSATNSFASVVMIVKVRIHSSVPGCFQFSQRPAIPNGEPSFIGNGIGLLGLLAFDCLPLEESIHGHDAPAQAVCIPEGRQSGDGLALGVDGLSASGRVLTPVWNEPPTQWVERHLAGLVIAPNDQQFLARRGIPPRRIVVHAGVAHVHDVDNGITKRSAALDYPATHDRDVGIDVTRRQFSSTSIARNRDERLLHGQSRSALHTFRLQRSGVGGLTACHESVNQGSNFTRSAYYQRGY